VASFLISWSETALIAGRRPSGHAISGAGIAGLLVPIGLQNRNDPDFHFSLPILLN
jgi:hypothetical protein